MKVKELIDILNKIENKELDVRIKFALDKEDEIGYYLEPFAVETIFEDEVNIYADYNITKEDCDFIGQVDLKEAYRKMLEKGE